MAYVSSRVACKILGIHANSLRKLADNEEINFIRIRDGGARSYDVDEFIARRKNAVKRPETPPVIHDLFDPLPNTPGE